MEPKRQVFSVDLLERHAAKGRGVITCMAAGNDVIVLGTSKGWVIRHDFGVGDSFGLNIDLSVGRPGEQSIHRVFVDPGGSHCIATVVGGGTADTFYTHAKWAKPRILGKLKGLIVNAVAWNKQHITEASTREIILGTNSGQIHEVVVDEKDKKEKYIKFLFELSELLEAFTGLQMETTGTNNGTRYYVMAVTPTRLYSFTGTGSLESVFASYAERAVHFMELPGEIPNSSENKYFLKDPLIQFGRAAERGHLGSGPNGVAVREVGLGMGSIRNVPSVDV
ncbi:Vacuolar protein sorting-associated protein 18 like protein [Orobanche hederae]